MTHAVLDDHLLRDLLADDMARSLRTLLRTREAATTNLYYVRLCRSAATARGGQLTGAWPEPRRRELARVLLALPASITIVPMRSIAFRIAELVGGHAVSTLGAEAVAAAEHLEGELCVWKGADGPRIRACAQATAVPYRTLAR